MVPRSSGSVAWWQFEALLRFDGLAHGVMSRRGGVAGICTACHADEFFSARRLGRPTGRFAAFVASR